jgi:AraC-like DNA-binding protein
MDIIAHLGDGALSIAAVASRQGVALRSLQKLFEVEGSSYSEFVLSERLTRAHGLLTNPLYAGRSISAIAYDVGFNDLSYFNRKFRQRYGMTPSDVRNHR